MYVYDFNMGHGDWNRKIRITFEITQDLREHCI